MSKIIATRSEPRYVRHDEDWYVEPEWAVEALLEAERFEGASWDPAAGTGTIPRLMWARGLTCQATDIVDRGCPAMLIADFAAFPPRGALVHNVISNPPFKLFSRFAFHGLMAAERKVALLGRLNLLESIGRDPLLGARPGDHPTPLARVYVSRRRINMPPGDSGSPPIGGKHAYAWYVWEKGWTGAPTIERF
jgi:hypothetical protein